MINWFNWFQGAVIVAVIFMIPVMLELKFLVNRLKERFLAKKGYIKAKFINQNRRAITKIILPDELGKILVYKGAYFINAEDGIFDIKLNKKVKLQDTGEAKPLDLSNGKKVLEGHMPTYYFVAGSSSPHDFFNEGQMDTAGTGILVKQAIESARGESTIQLLKDLIANKKLIMILLGILLAIGLSVVFTFQTQNTINSIQICKMVGSIAV